MPAATAVACAAAASRALMEYVSSAPAVDATNDDNNDDDGGGAVAAVAALVTFSCDSMSLNVDASGLPSMVGGGGLSTWSNGTRPTIYDGASVDAANDASFHGVVAVAALLTVAADDDDEDDDEDEGEPT